MSFQSIQVVLFRYYGMDQIRGTDSIDFIEFLEVLLLPFSSCLGIICSETSVLCLSTLNTKTIDFHFKTSDWGYFLFISFSYFLKEEWFTCLSKDRIIKYWISSLTLHKKRLNTVVMLSINLKNVWRCVLLLLVI